MAQLGGVATAAEDETNELALIEAKLEQGQLRSSLNQLSDLLTRRGDSASLRVRAWVTLILQEDYEQETSLRVGAPDAKAAPPAREQLKAEARQACETVRVIVEKGTDAVRTIYESSIAAGRAPTRNPFAGKGAESFQVVDEQAVVDARGVTKTHGSSGFTLQKIDVTVRPGQILGIVGTNGSGKSTLLDILRGATVPGEGRVYYPQLSRDPEDWIEIRPQIGYVPQRSNQWRGTVRENLEYAAAIHGIRGAENKARVDWLLTRHGLIPFENRRWSQLSGGYRMRFDLVLARVHKPKLLILDEPLANLDPVSQQMFLDDLKQMARGEAGAPMGIVLTSQHLYEIEAVIADLKGTQPDLLVLSGGRRVPLQKERPTSYFEVWSPGLAPHTLQDALGALRPAAGSGKSAEIIMGATAALVPLAKTATLAGVVETANAGKLGLTYVRDVTRSARVELETAAPDEPKKEDGEAAT